jgi:flagellar protein FlbD
MIRLSRLRNEAPLFINEDLIEKLDGHHETTVTLTNGDRFVVTESPEEVFRRVVEVRAIVAAVATRLAADPAFDHSQFLGEIYTPGGEQ